MADARVLTVRQPWASLVMAGVKDVENRTRPVPSTLPQWWKCRECGVRWIPRLGNYCGCLPGEGAHEPDGPFPFRLWIHAGLEWDGSGAAQSALNDLRVALERRHRVNLRTGDVRREAMWLRGALLGSVEVTGHHHADEHEEPVNPGGDHTVDLGPIVPQCSRWAKPDHWHITLADPQPLPQPILCRGRQGWWRLPDGVAEQARAQGVAL